MPIRSSTPEASFERISPRIPLVEMASQSISMLPYAGAEMLKMLSSLVRRLPCYRFHLGHRPTLIPAAISDLIPERSRKGMRPTLLMDDLPANVLHVIQRLSSGGAARA